jgi:tetratricopeptide (TPR) repeat protein
MLAHAGKKEAAREYAHRAIRCRRRIASSGEETAAELNEYALLLLTCEPEDLRAPEEALAAAERAHDLSDGQNPLIMDTLARACCMTGDLDRALEIQGQAAAKVAPANWHSKLTLDLNLAEYLLRSGDTESAMRLLDEMAAFENERFSDLFFLRAHWLDRHAMLLVEQGRYGLAVPIARECVDCRRDPPWETWKRDALFLECALGRCLAETGRREEAEALLKGGFEGMRNHPFSDLEEQQIALKWLIQYYEETDNAREASRLRALGPSVGLCSSEWSAPGRK